MLDMPTYLVNIGSAVVLGMVIGLERQWRQRLAGLRTNALVCVGSALFVTLSLMMDDEVSPTRVAAQVVSGIGFLGGGVILREGLNVRGLNTAATLWCAAAVGVLCGAGYISLAAIGSFVILFVNMMLRPLSRLVDSRLPSEPAEEETLYHITLTCRDKDEIPLRTILLQSVSSGSLWLQQLTSRDAPAPPKGRLIIDAEMKTPLKDDVAIERLTARLCMEPGVSSISWKKVNPEEEARRPSRDRDESKEVEQNSSLLDPVLRK